MAFSGNLTHFIPEVNRVVRAYFRKAGHACGINEKGHILVNLGHFEEETALV